MNAEYNKWYKCKEAMPEDFENCHWLKRFTKKVVVWYCFCGVDDFGLSHRDIDAHKWTDNYKDHCHIAWMLPEPYEE